MKNKLEHRQVTFRCSELSVEYAACGSHQLEVTVSFPWTEEYEQALLNFNNYKCPNGEPEPVPIASTESLPDIDTLRGPK